MRRREVLAGWVGDPDFRAAFRALLEGPQRAVRWELPAWTAATLDLPYTQVVLDAPGLCRPADSGAFAGALAGQVTDGAVSFLNLGGDAVLVVPTLPAVGDGYAHLADFRRTAPAAAWDALWAEVGRCVAARLGTRPVWISTAGAGVPWLHVRLDDQPKYYHHAPYRTDGVGPRPER